MVHKPLSIHTNFFIPMLVIYILITLSHHLVFFENQEATPEIQTEIFSIAVFVFVCLITMIRFLSLHQICLGFFAAYPILLAICAPFTNLPIYYIVLVFWCAGSFFFFWAYANNHFSFRQAGLYYPLFLAVTIIGRLALLHIPVNLTYLNIIAIFISATIFFLFLLTYRRLQRITHESDRRGKGVDEMFELDYRVVLGGVTFSLALLAVLSRHRVTGSIDTIWEFALLGFLFILSWLLFRFRGTAWRFTAYGVLFTIIVTYGEPLSFIHFFAPIIMVLKEMSFIAVPQSMRFLTKTWVDLFFVGCGLGLGHLLLSTQAIIGIIATIIAMIIYTFCVHIAGTRLEQWSPPQ